MVLSANVLGVRRGLIPLFCCNCGNRIGWCDDSIGDNNALNYCDDCAKLDKEDLRCM